MSELKQHEVQVENKAGEKLVVSAAYYAKNKNKLKMLNDNGWANKMDELDLSDKSLQTKGGDTKIKAKDHKGKADMTEAEILAEEEKKKKAKKEA